MTKLLSSSSSKITALFLCLALVFPLVVPVISIGAPEVRQGDVRVALGRCTDETEGAQFAKTVQEELALAVAAAQGCALVSRDESTPDCILDARLVNTKFSESGRAAAELVLELRDGMDGRVIKRMTVEGDSRSRPGLAAQKQALVREAIAQAAATGAREMAAKPVYGVTGLREKRGYCRIVAGADDGITEGSQFDIFRGSQQIGRVQAVEVGRMDSLCKIIELQEGVRLRQGDMAQLSYRAAPKPKKKRANWEKALGILFAAGLIYLIARNSGGRGPVVAEAASRLTLTATPDTIAANGTDTAQIAATVVTEESTPVPDGTEVRFRVTNNLGFVQPSATTENGVATVTLTAATTPGTAIVEASVGTVTNTVNVTFTATGQTAQRVTITAGNASILADGQSTTDITVTVRDEAGQLAQQGTVNFSTTAGTFVGGGATISVPLANGTAVATLQSAPTEQTATITATLAGTTESASTTVQFTNILITGISANPTAIQVGGAETATVTAEIITTVGDPVSDGTVVNFALDAASVASGAQITQSATTTNGTATAIVRSGTLAGPVQVMVSVGGVSARFTPLTFTAAPPDSIIMAVETNKWNTPANTIDPVGITAVVADQFNNPVADGTSVYFTTDRGVITGSAETQKGVATAQIRSDGSLGIANVQARTVDENGNIVTGNITKLFSGPPATVTFLAPASGTTLLSGSSLKVTVEVLDVNGFFVVGGTKVEFTATGGSIGSASTEDGQNYSTASVDYTAPDVSAPTAVTITALAGHTASASLSINVIP